MTLPSSGALTMSAINAEFGRGNNLNAYRGTTWYTDAGASGTFTSTNLGFDQFYSKRATSPTFSFTIGSNQTNANLRSLAVSAGWNQSSNVVATIASGVIISSNSTGTPALTINGSFPGGVGLVNNGTIVGMGGSGGYGGNHPYSGGGGGGPGGAGGTAVSVSVATTITNNGTFAGGGGGGGGGITFEYSYSDPKGSYTTRVAGSGGGGGRSSYVANSSGGPPGACPPGQNAGNPGNAGTYSAAGTGGAGYYSAGGNGATWGAAGSAGYNPGYGVAGPPGAGGAGGAAVSGNSNVTWNATGTRYGALT